MHQYRRKWRSGGFAAAMMSVLLFLGLPLNVAQAQSRNTLECPTVLTERVLPENSVVDFVETDGYSGAIGYTTPGGESLVETLLFTDWEAAWWANPHPWFDHARLQGKLDEVSFGFTGLQGLCLKEAIFTYEACLYNAGFGPWMVYWDRWTFLAKRCEGSQTGGGGGNKAGEPAKFEGFIDQISEPDITIGKEGTFTTVTVTGGTTITLNGNRVTLDVLQPGDKATAKYDPGTSEASEIKAER